MLESKEFAAYSNGQVIDEGLRNFMLKIYNYMAGGLCATALAAYIIVSNTSLLRLFFNESGYSAFGWLALFAPLILVFAFGWVLQRGTLQQVQAMFWGVFRIDGRFSCTDFSGIYRCQHRPCLFNHGSNVWRSQPVRIYD